MVIVKKVATVSGMVKFASKLDFLFFFINLVGIDISLDCHYKLLEYSRTSMTQTRVWPIDGFKQYLDRQFTYRIMVLNVYTLSQVYPFVTYFKLTLYMLVKAFASSTHKEGK